MLVLPGDLIPLDAEAARAATVPISVTLAAEADPRSAAAPAIKALADAEGSRLVEPYD
jgi:hypothetical protein